MAMPASGNIAILSTPQTCGSISCAVDGNNTPPKCLTTLGSTAGFSAPFCMSDFYGYSPTSAIPVSLVTLTCYSATGLEYCSTRICACGLSTGNCYVPHISWMLSGVESRNTACVKLYCNGSVKCSCYISNTSDLKSGTWCPTIAFGTCWTLCTYARALTGFGSSADACADIISIDCTSGSYCIGTPHLQESSAYDFS